MQRVYLDNAATTAIRPEVVDEMANVMRNVFGNPSSTHVFGREAKALIEMARKNIAQLLECFSCRNLFYLRNRI
jgi:cysteine desulfurase